MEAAQEIQGKLDALQQEMHLKVEACDAKYNQEKNVVFQARSAAIAELVAKKELPANFWALAFIRLLEDKDKEESTMPHFLGPYDEALLTNYLEEVKVNYTEHGRRVALVFKPNPFFEESELWAEELDTLGLDEEDDEEEAPPKDEAWSFSGVTWKEEHGPKLEDEEEEEEEEDEAPGKKRPRAGEGEKRNASADGPVTQGPSVLGVFSEMPPHPEEDSDMDECDSVELGEASQSWEEEMEDRKMLLSLVELVVHRNPANAFAQASVAAAADGEVSKKSKVE